MAVLKNIRADHTLPVLGGRFIVKTWRGKLVMQSWPKKRSRPLPAQTLAQNERFKNANFLAKFAPPDQQKMAIELGKKGPLYPRDYLTAAMTSGLYIYQLGPNRKVYPVSVRNEISAELDIIAQTPGSMMARGQDYWEPLVPGSLYQVPAVITPGGIPVMTSPGPEIGGHGVSNMQRTTVNTGTAAGKGFYGELQQDIRVTNLIPSFDGIFGEDYKVEIWRYDGTKIVEKMDESDTQNWQSTAFGRRRFLMNDQPILSAGTQYAFIFLRTSATGASTNGLYLTVDKSAGGLPFNDIFGFMSFAQTSLAVNDTPTFSALNDPGCLDAIYVF